VIEEEEERIIKSDDHRELNSLRQRKEQLDNEISVQKSKLYTDFSVLERPLRKYQRMAYQFDKLIEHYYTDSLSALVGDFSLKILQILKGLEKNIKENKLELKDRKADKVLDMIEKMDEAYFTEFLKKYNNQLKEKESIEKQIRESKVQRELDNLDDEGNKMQSKLDNIKIRLKAVQEEHDSIDIGKKREKIKQDIEKAMKVKIEFS
jgi:hypothetical protein